MRTGCSTPVVAAGRPDRPGPGGRGGLAGRHRTLDRLARPALAGFAAQAEMAAVHLAASRARPRRPALSHDVALHRRSPVPCVMPPP